MSADRERLKLAEEIGACDYTVDVQREDMKKLVNDLTGGYGVDVVLECSGSQSGTCSGLDLIKKRGYFCQIGLGGKRSSSPLRPSVIKNCIFPAPWGPEDIAGQRPLSSLRTKR